VESAELKLVWDKYRSRVFAFILGKVTSREEAEDILQEAFLRLHTGICCLQEWTMMERYIFRITRNLIIDGYRARKPAASLDEEIEAEAGTVGDWIETEPAARLAFSLKDMVDELPEPYREALLLTEYEGLTQAELARRAGISVSGAKSRVQRARTMLKDLLLECCHFELDSVGGIIDYRERCCRCRRGACPSDGASLKE
jgi:RNA polymerase sigma-70 factor, ECF subfamily